MISFNKNTKLVILILADVLCSLLASFLSLLIIENNGVLADGETIVRYLIITGINIALTLGLSFLLKLYSNMWRYAGFIEGFKILFISAVILVFDSIFYVIDRAATTNLLFSIRWALGYFFIFVSMSGIIRFSYRIYDHVVGRYVKHRGSDVKKVMIVGAGAAGAMLVKEINEKIDKMKVVCFIDDMKKKRNQVVAGVQVVGDRNDIVEKATEYQIDEIIVAIPSLNSTGISEILNICNQTKCKVKTLPAMYQLINGQVSVASVRNVEIQDLLGREAVKTNLDEVMGYIKGSVVLVTGGGGSIGSELCRQIANHQPKKLIIVDIYENNAYDIQQELLKKHKDLDLLVLIASVRDSKKVNDIFEKYKPDVVFHAAAHKHVPLMEDSPNEAIKNNVMGTLKVARAADKNGAKRFVLISTDKAVNPTNLMGASKRICEMIIQTMSRHSKTEFVAVRFGNVLGSNGSVIPLFKKQIAAGGPVTVTHKEITRYFMTIPEAVELVLQAGAYAKGGEIFVLDMGQPVKIYDLAEKLIRLSGYEPNVDMKIEVVGLRPGEKLYEERLMEEEGLQKTANDMISIAKPLNIDEENLLKKLDELYVEAYKEVDNMKELVRELVPEYKIDERKTGAKGDA